MLPLTNWATWGVSPAASTAALWNGHPRKTVALSDSSGSKMAGSRSDAVRGHRGRGCCSEAIGVSASNPCR